MCVSYVSGDLRTRCVDDATTLPGAFVDWLARPSLPWHVLVVVHSDALVRGGDRCGPGTANHNVIGGTVGGGVGSVGVLGVLVVVVIDAAVVVVIIIGSGDDVVVVIVVAWWTTADAATAATADTAAGTVRRRGMSILAERWRGRTGAPRGAATARAGAQDGLPTGGHGGRVRRAGQTHQY